jgi:hypothetical protein
LIGGEFMVPAWLDLQRLHHNRWKNRKTLSRKRREEPRLSSGRISEQARRNGRRRPGEVFPPDTPALAPACAVAGDPMSGALEAAELFDIHIDQFARAFLLVAPHQLGRLQRPRRG